MTYTSLKYLEINFGIRTHFFLTFCKFYFLYVRKVNKFFLSAMKMLQYNFKKTKILGFELNSRYEKI